MIRWEYKVVTEMTISDLDELGYKGWELIQVTTSFAGSRYFFKRNLIYRDLEL